MSYENYVPSNLRDKGARFLKITADLFRDFGENYMKKAKNRIHEHFFLKDYNKYRLSCQFFNQNLTHYRKNVPPHQPIA